MREVEKREFSDNYLIQEYLKRAKSDFGEKNVSYTTIADGKKILIEISNSEHSVQRKQHTMPEYLRKQGD